MIILIILVIYLHHQHSRMVCMKVVYPDTHLTQKVTTVPKSKDLKALMAFKICLLDSEIMEMETVVTAVYHLENHLMLRKHRKFQFHRHAACFAI